MLREFVTRAGVPGEICALEPSARIIGENISSRNRGREALSFER
jgi:hypothetical protein